MSISSPPKKKAHILTRLFSIQPGKEKKTILLYGLFFAFWLGLRWGDTASYALFLDNSGAEGLSLIFIGNAVLAFTIGLVYNSFAGRVNNERLLLVLLGATILWLSSVQVLLLNTNEAISFVYPYYYLVSGAVADLTVLHILNYISDFYDTRAAKRALPFLLSTGFIGAIVAGVTIQPIPSQYTPLAWIACVLVMIAFVVLIRRLLPTEIKRIEQRRQASHNRRQSSKSGLENLRAGFRFVRTSGILRWLTLATLIYIILMNLLAFQASQVFDTAFQDRPGDDLKKFLGQVDGISNIVGLVLAQFAFRPLLSRLGVGITNMVFPFINLLALGTLGFFPHQQTAVFGRLTNRIFKKAFRNPVDALLYNSVPQNIKTLGRGFVNGLVVPLGTLMAGLLVYAIRENWLTLKTLTTLSLSLGIAYVFIALRVRKEYTQALADMLAQDELSVFYAASQADTEWLDPATIELLYHRLDTTEDDHALVLLAELLYNLEGHKALGYLQQLALQRGPQVRARIIRALGHDWIGDPDVRTLCLEGLSDSNLEVRQAAAIALAESPNAAHDETVLSYFRARMNDPDETIQASVIPVLMASGDFHYYAPAVKILSDWLSLQANVHHRTFGLRVLFKMGNERMARTLVRHLNDRSPLVRRQAAEILGQLTIYSSQTDFITWGIHALRRLLSDADTDVQLVAINNLGQIRSVKASKALMVALSNRSFEVRQQACAAMQIVIKPELQQALNSDNPYLVESAAFMLARANRRHVRLQARLRINEHIDTLIREAYRLHYECVSLATIDTDGAHLLIVTLQEEADQLIERVLWLAGATSGEEKARAVRQGLQSTDSLTQINAAETLEAITSPKTARLVTPMYDGTPLPKLAQTGQDVLGLSPPELWEIFCRVWPQLVNETFACETDLYQPTPDRGAWLTATAMYTLLEMVDAKHPSDARLSLPRIHLIAQKMLNASFPIVRETAQLVLDQLDSTDESSTNIHEVEQPMLTIIEKVISLRKIQAFQNMSIDELRLLADISEEATYSKGQQILIEGERGDALYVIINGKVSVQRKTDWDITPGDITYLAALGPGEYFAEMSLFDDAPHSADVVALEDTELLAVRQAPLVAVIKQRPELALGLFKVLSQRLRQANEVIAQTQGEYIDEIPTSISSHDSNTE
ncbi:MAG: cyclic nucleotide-binding domain-containing protein [Chloroflexi bacterium]|nr:cyclic nucleotide-binding domain-containing protein [Chloroflexota bacterium]